MVRTPHSDSVSSIMAASKRTVMLSPGLAACCGRILQPDHQRSESQWADSASQAQLMVISPQDEHSACMHICLSKTCSALGQGKTIDGTSP